MTIKVDVVSGDITQEPADALITAINSDGMWFGGVDWAIKNVAGNMFHSQAAKVALENGKVVFARSTHEHDGKFSNVIFVVDDLEWPLSEVILAALAEADKRGMRVVTLPALRTGVMAGEYEPTVQAALEMMASAIHNFSEGASSTVEQIRVVVYDDIDSAEKLKKLVGI